MVIQITDIQDERLAPYAMLTNSQLRNRLEPQLGLLIAESPKVISLALDAGYTPVSLLMENKHILGDGAEIIRRCGDIPIYTADRDVLAGLTGYTLTRGVLCAMRRPTPPSPDEILKSAGRITILDSIVDSTNVGAIIRSAAALGMDGILFTENCCDPLCRRSVRVSMGTVFQIPWAVIPKDYLQILKNYNFKTVALALTDKSVSIDNSQLCGEKRLAIILGTEGNGLSPAVIEACDYTAKIPMFHGVDSLNVGAAGAIAFWQLRKQ